MIDFYRGAFARLPDDAGLKYWVNRFRAAQCKPAAQAAGAVYGTASTIATAFFGSAEYWSVSPTASGYTSDLYNALIRRSADVGGFNFWVGRIATSALTFDQVRQSFIDSPEFGARVQAIAAAGCVAPMP